MKDVGFSLSTNCDEILNIAETYSCRLRMKSSDEDSWVRMQPGSGETHVLYVQ